MSAAVFVAIRFSSSSLPTSALLPTSTTYNKEASRGSTQHGCNGDSEMSEWHDGARLSLSALKMNNLEDCGRGEKNWQWGTPRGVGG